MDSKEGAVSFRKRLLDDRHYVYDGATVGERIRELRKERGYSLDKAVDIIGVGHTTLAEIESGRRCPRLDTFAMIARCFDVPLDYLLYGEFAVGTINEDLYDLLLAIPLKSQQEILNMLRSAVRLNIPREMLGV